MRHRTLSADDGGLGLKQVLSGFDQDGIATTANQPTSLRLVSVAKGAVLGVKQRGQLCAGANRAEYPAWLLRCIELVGYSSSYLRASLGKFFDSALDAILGEVRKVRTKGVGLNRLRTCRQVGAVNVGDDVLSSDVQNLVAAFVSFEVSKRRSGGLNHCSHCAIGNDHAIGDGVDQ